LFLPILYPSKTILAFLIKIFTSRSHISTL
jgi:hypothetical protein